MYKVSNCNSHEVFIYMVQQNSDYLTHSPIQLKSMVWYINISLLKLIKVPDKLTSLKTVKNSSTE
jgi:hypothetical protein